VTTGTNNQLSDDGTYSYSYDDNGNLTTRTRDDGTDTVLYTWDYRNRLSEVTYEDASLNVTKTVDYEYDTHDRRIGLAVTTSSGTTGTLYLYDGNDLALTIDLSTLTLADRFLMGPGQNQLLAQENIGTGAVSWTLTDHLGSVTDVVDGGSGHNLLDHIVYDSFGNIVSQSNSSYATQMLYTGYQYDSDTGLYYANARYYNPGTGTFLSQDPSGFAAGDMNLYRYVASHPTYATDPTGLFEGGWYHNLGFDQYAGLGASAPSFSNTSLASSLSSSATTFANAAGALAAGSPLLSAFATGLGGLAGMAYDAYGGSVGSALDSAYGAMTDPNFRIGMAIATAGQYQDMTMRRLHPRQSPPRRHHRC
jgi:RHS repeat-associated protein